MIGRFRFLAIDTANGKIVGKPRRGFASALMLPIAPTCPDSCSFKARGDCYARGGRTAIHVSRLERLTEGMTADAIAEAAAREIEGASAAGLAAGRVLRLFVSGDARTAAIARRFARAARAWVKGGGRKPYGYSHAWRDVPASAWRGASILASVETLQDAKKAIARGYAPAIVVPEHPADGRTFDAGGIRWIPCPEQTRGVPCVACGLCFDADALRSRGSGIAFAAHGVKVNALKRRLPILQSTLTETEAA